MRRIILLLVILLGTSGCSLSLFTRDTKREQATTQELVSVVKTEQQVVAQRTVTAPDGSMVSEPVVLTVHSQTVTDSTGQTTTTEDTTSSLKSPVVQSLGALAGGLATGNPLAALQALQSQSGGEGGLASSVMNMLGLGGIAGLVGLRSKPKPPQPEPHQPVYMDRTRRREDGADDVPA